MGGVAYHGKLRFKYEYRGKDSNVLRVRVKATVRKDGSVHSQYPAEIRNDKGEWEETTVHHIVRAESLSYSPEKGKPYRHLAPYGFGIILALYDPEPTWEGEDGEEESRSES